MPDSEFTAALVKLTPMLLNWRIGPLVLLLLMAAVWDYRTQRIPNWLVLPGMVFGLAVNMLIAPLPGAAFWWPLAGLAVGFIGFMPLYLIRAMGAGDVKLMAMVGAFVGPEQTFWILLYTMVAGGVLSLALVLMRGTARRLFRNIALLFQFAYSDVTRGVLPNFTVGISLSAGKLPYAVAIAIGTLSYLVLHRSNFV